MRPTTRRVAIVSGVRLFREGLQQLLNGCGEVEVTAIRRDLAGLASDLGESGCDVVLLDFAAVGDRGRIEALRAAVPGIRVVAIAAESDDASLMGYATAGVDAVIDSEGTVDSLVEIVTGRYRGEKPVASLAHADPLTQRELEIVGLIDAGLSNKEIAEELGLSPATIKNHVHNLLTKLGVARRGAAAARVRSTRHAGKAPGAGT